MKALALFVALFFSSAAQAQPSRLISLNLCTDQFALAFKDFGHKPLGVSFVAADKALSLYEPQLGDIPLLRGTSEEIVQYNPDLVLLGEGQNPALQTWLNARKIPIATLGTADDIPTAQKQLRDMAVIWGKQSEAEAIIQAQEAAFTRAHLSGKPRIAIYYTRGFSDAGGTLFDEVITRMGGVNVGAAEGLKGMRYLSLESLVALKPDLLIVPQYDYGTVTGGQALTEHPAFAAIGAQIVRVPGSYFTCPHLAIEPLVDAIGSAGRVWLDSAAAKE